MPDQISVNPTLTPLDDLSSESDVSELTLEVNATAEGYRPMLDMSQKLLTVMYETSCQFWISQMKIARCLTLYKYLTLLREPAIVKVTTVQMKLVIYLMCQLRWWMKP